jgi:hypothetical protein
MVVYNSIAILESPPSGKTNTLKIMVNTKTIPVQIKIVIPPLKKYLPKVQMIALVRVQSNVFKIIPSSDA